MSIPEFYLKIRSLSSSDEKNAPSSRFTATDKIIAALLLILAFGLYSLSGMETQSGFSPFSKYPGAALRFLQGGLDAERLLDYSPVYLGLCVLIAKYCAASFQSLPWIQIVLVALTGSGLFLVLRRHFGRIISLCGALAFLLNAGVMVYSGVLEPEPVMMALLVLLVLFTGSRTPTGSLSAGVILIVCFFTRPTVFLLALAIPLYLWLNLPERCRARAITQFLIPVLIGMAFFTIKSFTLTGSFPPPLMNPGTVFFEGNSPLASGAVVEYPPLIIDLADELSSGEVDYDHVVYRLLARRASDTPLNQTQTNRVWASAAMHFIQDEPIHLLGQITHKLYYIFHAYQWHDLPQAHVTESSLRKRFIPLVPLSLVSALALCGLVVGFSRWRVFFLLYFVFFNQVAVMLITYASARQRLALIPFLIFFAVVGLDWLIRSRPLRVVPVLIVLLLGGVFALDTDLMRSNSSLWDNYNLHNQIQKRIFRLRDEGRLSEAAELLPQSIAATPWLEALGARPAGLPVPSEGLAKAALRVFPTIRGDDANAGLDRAILMIDAGELDAAEQTLTQLLQEGHAYYRCFNRPASPTFYLGRIAFRRGHQAEAVDFMKTALSHAPGDPIILAQLAALTNDEQYVAKLIRYFGKINAFYFFGIAYLENGQSGQAAIEFEQLLYKVPEYRRGQILLAASLADVGRDERAIEIYMGATQKGSELVLWADRILPAFRRRAELSAADDLSWFLYAAVLTQFGYYLEARDILKKSLAVTDNPNVRNSLADVEATIQRAGLSGSERMRP